MKYPDEQEKEKEEQSCDYSSSENSLKTAPSSAGSPILSRTIPPPARIKVPYAAHYTDFIFFSCNRAEELVTFYESCFRGVQMLL
jgi:hypothetical protein